MLFVYNILHAVIVSINTREMVRSIFEVKEKMIVKDKMIKDEEL